MFLYRISLALVLSVGAFAFAQGNAPKLAIVGLPTPDAPRPPAAEDKVPYSVLKNWNEARVKHSTVVSLIDEAAYAKLFTESFAEFRSPKPVPERVDFKSKQVVAICWGTRNSTGYTVSVVSVTGTPKETTITVKTTVPKGLANPAETHPAIAVVIPKTESVKVVVTGDRLPAGWSDFTDLRKGLEVNVSPATEDKVPYAVLKDWYELRVKEPTIVTLADEAAYAKLFADSFAEFHSPKPVPERVDFKSKQVVAICWGVKPSTYYSISVVSVTGTPKGTIISVKTTIPKGLADPAKTYPAVVVVIPKTESVKVVVTGDRLPAGWSDFTDLRKGLEVNVSPPAAGPKGESPKKDAGPAKEMELFQGDWVLVESVTPDGTVCKHREGQPDTNHFNIYVKKDRAIIHYDGTDPDDEFVTMFTVDPSKKPKEIDFVGVSSTVTGAKAKGRKMLGVYHLDGDTLLLAMGWSGVDAETRPTDLKPKPGKEISSYKFSRSKKPISDDSTRVNERP